MKRLFAALFIGAVLLSPAQAQIVHYVGANGVDPITVSSANPLPTTPNTVYTTTDKGGTISVGGTPQTAIAANSARKIWCIQNDPSATEVLSVRVGSAASATTGIILAVGAQACSSAGMVDTGLVSVYAATGGHRYFGFEGQ